MVYSDSFIIHNSSFNTPIMDKINLAEKFALFSEYWSPKIVGELNGQHVKLAKFKGEFVWHQHEQEDEMFFIVEGTLTIEFRDKTVTLNKGEFMIVPKGVEHKPVAKNEVWVMLFEPAATLNTGNAESELTQHQLDRL
jgi:mannose-6-phosphate isomerase-like protein (cupin superfamily)